MTCFGENIKRREKFQKLMMIQNQKRSEGGGGVLYYITLILTSDTKWYGYCTPVV